MYKIIVIKLFANKENLNFIWWDKFITFYANLCPFFFCVYTHKIIFGLDFKKFKILDCSKNKIAFTGKIKKIKETLLFEQPKKLVIF
uniref:Uncharacterized protein n=1 Tax=Strongyloides papillosus TaxID=174720 RepID=A0A0N5B6X3_STREA